MSSKVFAGYRHMSLENENMLGMCAQNRLLMLLQNSLAEPRAAGPKQFRWHHREVFKGYRQYAPGKREYVPRIDF